MEMQSGITFQSSRITNQSTFGLLSWALFLGVLLFEGVSAAQPQQACPEPSVAIYSCDPWQANTDSTNAITLSRIISGYIYATINADSSVDSLLMISGSAIDSVTYSNSGHPFIYFPFVAPADSVGETTWDYILMSDVSGTDGNFILTVSLENGYTRYHIADDTAHFASAADTSSMLAASRTAIAPLIPLAAVIRNYEEQLKTSNPALCINPEISVTPLVKKLALNASTPVTIVVTDCDGGPLPDRTLTLSAKGGMFVSSPVTTDQNGQATVVFTAGNKSKFGVLTASLRNAPTVRYDTISTDGFSDVTIGNPVDTTGMFELVFHMGVLELSVSDKFVYQKKTSEEWDQNATLRSFSVDGIDIVQASILDNGSLEFSTSSHDSLLFSTGSMIEHDFGLSNGWAWSSSACENTYVGTTGKSLNGKCDSTGAAIGVEDFATGQSLTADAQFSNCEGSSYLETFGFSNCSDDNTPARADFYEMTSLVADASNPNVSISGSRSTGFGISAEYSKTVSHATFSAKDGSSTSDSIMTTRFSGFLRPVSSLTGVDLNQGTLSPSEYVLQQNYPNPFNPSTVIRYQLSANSRVTLKVYDALGREVAGLVDGQQTKGEHAVIFNASRYASGVYFYRIEAVSNDGKRFDSTRKLLLMK